MFVGSHPNHRAYLVPLFQGTMLFSCIRKKCGTWPSRRDFMLSLPGYRLLNCLVIVNLLVIVSTVCCRSSDNGWTSCKACRARHQTPSLLQHPPIAAASSAVVVDAPASVRWSRRVNTCRLDSAQG